MNQLDFIQGEHERRHVLEGNEAMNCRHDHNLREEKGEKRERERNEEERQKQRERECDLKGERQEGSTRESMVSRERENASSITREAALLSECVFAVSLSCCILRHLAGQSKKLSCDDIWVQADMVKQSIERSEEHLLLWRNDSFRSNLRSACQPAAKQCVIA